MIRVFAALAISALTMGQAVQGVTRDSNGKPLSAVTVSLSDGLVVHSDAEGKYRFKAQAGKFTVRAELPGYAAAVTGPFELGVTETKQIDLALTPIAADFFDEPNFVVAGVTDSVNRGGHGSETVIRSTEALTRAAAALKKEGASPADLEEKLGNTLEAARDYQRAAELSPTEKTLFDWGTELLIHRAADQSAEVFAKGHRLFPRSSRMLLGLGAALYARGSYHEAARWMFEAVDLDPNDPGPYAILGKIENVEIRQMDGFIERLEQFARLHPNSAVANYDLAAALWDRQKTARVESLLTKALRLDPSLADAHLQLGVLYASRKDFRRAIEQYRAAPDKIEAHYRLGQAYQQTGEKEKARQEFALFEELRKSTAEEEERQRGQIQQFVFALRER